MEIAQLLSFYQIVKTGSFSKASEQVFRTQSALSHQINKLETELNVKLFDRSRKLVRLTTEGEILSDFASKLLNDLENLKRVYKDTNVGEQGTLTVATSSSALTYVFPNILKKLVRKFPSIKLKLITCNWAPELQSLVLDGMVDLGISIRSGPCPKKLSFLLWKSFDKFLIVPRNHPLSKTNKLHMNDIANCPLILYQEGSWVRREIEEAFVRNNLEYEIIMELDVSQNIKKYVQMGMGISIIPSLVITKEDKRKMSFLNVTNLFNKSDFGIYYRRDRYVTAPMIKLISCFAPKLLNKMKIGEV